MNSGFDTSTVIYHESLKSYVHTSDELQSTVGTGDHIIFVQMLMVFELLHI